MQNQLFFTAILLFCALSFCKAQSTQKPPPPPPPPKPPIINCQEMWTLTEVMPRFPYDTATCEAHPEECGKQALISFIYDNLNYDNVKMPEETSKKHMAVVTFAIEKTGEVHDIRLVRDLPHIEGAGEEALRLVRLMRDKIGPWTPGTQGGKKVRVQYNLPIKFDRVSHED